MAGAAVRSLARHTIAVPADEAEFANSLRKLRAGAILNPAAHPPLRIPHM